MNALFFPVILTLFCSIAFKTLFINKEKFKVEIDLFSVNKEWNKVLSFKSMVGNQDRIARFQLNRALFETGQMSENLFAIPQEWGEYSLLLNKEFSKDCLSYSSDLYNDFGFIKAAKYWMIEYQTYAPYAPKSLERLAISSLTLGEISTARKYFTILSKSIIYRESSKILIDRLSNEPFKLMREFKPDILAIIKDENPINLREPDLDLYNVLKVSPKNKMAFEYLMSYYILRNDLINFYRFLPLVLKSGFYTQMPKTYEEALIQYYVEVKRPVSTWEFVINKNTIERYKVFNETFLANRSDPVRLKEILKPGFKNTYWYYANFDSPKAKGKSIKSKGT